PKLLLTKTHCSTDTLNDRRQAGRHPKEVDVTAQLPVKSLQDARHTKNDVQARILDIRQAVFVFQDVVERLNLVVPPLLRVFRTHGVHDLTIPCFDDAPLRPSLLSRLPLLFFLGSTDVFFVVGGGFDVDAVAELAKLLTHTKEDASVTHRFTESFKSRDGL